MPFPLGRPAKLWFQLWMVPTSRAGLPLKQLLALVVWQEEELGPASQQAVAINPAFSAMIATIL